MKTHVVVKAVVETKEKQPQQKGVVLNNPKQ
jgi:hypothetical protein